MVIRITIPQCAPPAGPAGPVSVRWRCRRSWTRQGPAGGGPRSRRNGASLCRSVGHPTVQCLHIDGLPNPQSPLGNVAAAHRQDLPHTTCVIEGRSYCPKPSGSRQARVCSKVYNKNILFHSIGFSEQYTILLKQ